MTHKSNSRDLNGFAAFATAISAATGRMNDFSTRLATLTKVSEMAALQIAKISTTAAQMIAPDQQLATCCQCKAAVPPQTTSKTWAHLEVADQAFVISTAVLAGAKLWTEAAKWFWTTVVAPIGAGGASAIGRLVIPMWRAVSASGALAAVIETVGELIGAIAAVVVSAPPGVIAAGAALVAGAGFLVWRNWNAVVEAVRNLGAATSHEVIAIIGKIASAILVEPEDGYEDPIPADDSRNRRSRWSRLKNIAPSVLDASCTNIAAIRPLAFLPSQYSSTPRGWQNAGAFAGMAAGMLAVPLLMAPALAAIPSARPGIDTASGASIVINSTPTIVINSNEPNDIEHRVREALKHHREAIYEQWCSERQRRQRTEF